MTTAVKNVLNSKEQYFFANEYSPVENMVSTIIIKRNQTSNLLNEDLRSRIIKEFNLVERVSKNGDLICFCEKLDLFARQQSNKH